MKNFSKEELQDLLYRCNQSKPTKKKPGRRYFKISNEQVRILSEFRDERNYNLSCEGTNCYIGQENLAILKRHIQFYLDGRPFSDEDADRAARGEEIATAFLTAIKAGASSAWSYLWVRLTTYALAIIGLIWQFFTGLESFFGGYKKFIELF